MPRTASGIGVDVLIRSVIMDAAWLPRSQRWEGERQENQRRCSRSGTRALTWKHKGEGGRRKWAKEKFRARDP